MDANSFFDDITPKWQLKVRWDINSDGIWETSFSIFKEFPYRFPKEGTYRIICECMDSDGNVGKDVKTILVRPIFKDSILVDESDNKRYKIVLIHDRWWMSQGLRTGKGVPVDVASYDNELNEFYVHPNDVDTAFGGFYTWNEATLYGRDTIIGICPNGWRLPRNVDIIQFQNMVWLQPDVGQYSGPFGLFGTDFKLTGRFIVSQQIFNMRGVQGEFWINDGKQPVIFRTWANYDGQYYPKVFFEGNIQTQSWIGWNSTWGSFSYSQVAIPLRCIKINDE